MNNANQIPNHLMKVEDLGDVYQFQIWVKAPDFDGGWRCQIGVDGKFVRSAMKGRGKIENAFKQIIFDNVKATIDKAIEAKILTKEKENGTTQAETNPS